LFSRSIAAALALFLAVEEPSRRPLPSRSRRAVPCRRGAVAPSITVKDRCCVMRRPLILLLLLLRSRPDLLPVGGVAVLPLTICVHCSRSPSPPCPARSRRPPCSPACLRPRRSPSFLSSRSHRSDRSAPFRRRREDAPSSLIQSRRHRRRCRPHHPARARCGSGVHSASDGRRLHHCLR
jgi:hypothetical protein